MESYRLIKLLTVAATLYVTTMLHTAAYDRLDPYGSINIKWDIISWTPDGYVATVTMSNLQMYRPIMSPGWTMGWTWAKKEVIWSMNGAQATDQGDCSKFKGNIPHSCKRNPEIVDLLPGVPLKHQFTDCCKAGVMAAWGQDPSAAVSAFQVSVGHSGTSNTTVKPPKNFNLLGPGPGYICSPATIVSPSVFLSDGRRKSHGMMTWTVTCTYSQMLVSKYPTCCVSLSSFYNSKITPCPSCDCGCQNEHNCVHMNDPKISSVVKSNTPRLQCTQHMCPIRVHWHVKANYKKHWLVKISIINFRYGKNYTQWTLVAQHPNFNNITKLYKFVYKPLMLYNSMNETGMFYGIKHYNDLLLEAGLRGNVQSEMLLEKDKNIFTLQQGWAFPSKIYFSGDECMMPFPDSYPFLPNSAHIDLAAASSTLVTLVILILLAF